MLNARINVSLKMNNSALDRTILKMAERTARSGAGKVRDQAKRNIRSAGLIDTGALVQSVRVMQLQSGPTQRWKIYSPLDYATYQHEGTRPFGPRRAKVLRWKAKSGGGYVFSKRSSGVKATPFLREAAESLSIGDFAVS